MKMSTIYYHIDKNDWYQCEEPNGLIFGKYNTIISYMGSKQEHSLPFQVKRESNIVGPLIGILAGSSKDNTFFGNVKVLKRILLSLQDKGALGIVMTPNSIQEDSLLCFTFYQPFNKWIKLRTPLPNAVYNRIPYRRMEDSQHFSDIVSFIKKKRIPFFNPYFFSKWKVYQYLQGNEFISSFLPETLLLKRKEDLEFMITKHWDLYLKSSKGCKGIGLYRITKRNNVYIVETPKKKQSYPTLTSFWEKNKLELMQEDFIIQKAIPSDTFEGKRYDLRILCHYEKKDHTISGIGVRLSGKSEITTHVPNGGTIIPYELVRSRFNESILRQLVKKIGKELMEQTGAFIGEFSIDLGRTTDGAIYIYEINSKPMVFDEDHIQDKGIEKLTKLLIMKGTKA
ncbi:YheC/YheD family endospore coat-associated protein [Bacillus nitroreducens]